MKPISAQGTVPITGGIMYTPSSNSIGEVNNINICNVAATAYNVEVYRYMKEVGSLTLMFKLSLSSGDIVSKDITITLGEGDYLYLIPSVSTIEYIISGVEYLLP